MIYLGDTLPMPAADPRHGAGQHRWPARVWGMIPAIFKARWGTNETLFTLMMNYVAIQHHQSYCVALWENPYGSNSVGIINQQTQAGWFPELFGPGLRLQRDHRG